MRTAEAKWSESQGRWKINVQQDGIRKSFYSSKPGRKGKLEAERKADIWLDDNTPGGGQRVEALLELWISELQESTSESHWRQYDSYVRNWISPAIGKKRIEAVTENDLQRVINNAYSKGNLAAKTLKNIRAALCNFMKFCRGERATQLRPENLTIPSSAKRAEKSILQPEELRTLFASSETMYREKVVPDVFIHAYRFQVLTGLRPGELLGLQQSDIKGSLLTIRRAYNDKRQITQGKNANAARTFELAAQAQAELVAQQKMLAEMGLISMFVFCCPNGQPVPQYRYREAWRRYCKYNGIDPKLTPYELRHTFVSLNDEMPTALKKMVVGHSQNMDTDGVYSHQKQGDMARAAEYVQNAFDSALAR